MKHWVVTEHARSRFKKRFKKIAHSPGEFEHQMEQARALGRTGDREYHRGPCGAVFVVVSGVVKTVLKGSQLSDSVKTQLRGKRCH